MTPLNWFLHRSFHRLAERKFPWSFCSPFLIAVAVAGRVKPGDEGISDSKVRNRPQRFRTPFVAFVYSILSPSLRRRSSRVVLLLQSQLKEEKRAFVYPHHGGLCFFLGLRIVFFLSCPSGSNVEILVNVDALVAHLRSTRYRCDEKRAATWKGGRRRGWQRW